LIDEEAFWNSIELEKRINMHKDLHIFLDSSFKSYCCYSTKENPDIKKKFDQTMGNIEKKLPGFENDYEYIEMPLSLLEYIGIGKLLAKFSEKERIELESCFLSLDSLNDVMSDAQNDIRRVEILDDCIQSIFHRLVRFFMCNVDPIVLVLKLDEKLNEYPLYKNVIAMRDCFDEWKSCLSNNGRNSPQFYLLCVHLAWNTMVRHKCKDKTVNRNFLRGLIIFCAAPEQSKCNLPGAALFAGLTGEILFRQYGELLDPNLIDLVCRGYFDIHLNKRVPVMVISTDLKKQKERLKNYITGVKDINIRVDIISFFPGYLILVDQSGLAKDVEVIDIAQMIEDNALNL
jgi:hypothetical protein